VLVATRFVPVVSAYRLIDVYCPSALYAKSTRFAARPSRSNAKFVTPRFLSHSRAVHSTWIRLYADAGE
jgi:hypothetical protein